MKRVQLGFVLCGLAFGAASVSGQTIFSDNFDSYADAAALQAVWSPNGTAAALSTEQSHSAPQSVKMTGTEGLYRKLGAEYAATDDKPLVATFWMYDAPTATRQFNMLRSYAGTGLGDGALEQIYAVGIYNTVTVPGEVHDGTKYHARIAFGTGVGWLNLDAPGVPSRSEGWHKFTIEVKSSDVNFYVDDILGRSFSRGVVTTLDTVVLGSGLNVGPSYTDDVSVAMVPEPATLALLGLGGLLLRRRRAA